MNLTLGFQNEPLLVFKSTGHVYPRGHVTDTECITAAFETHWTKDYTLWACIRLAGERASETRGDQEKQAISYLHYFLLARPDLHVAHGLLTRKDTITFLGGDWGLWRTQPCGFLNR